MLLQSKGLFTSKLLNHLQIEMDLLTLHIYCSSCSLDYLKSWFESKSQLSIPDFSGYHCIIDTKKFSMTILN